GGSCAAGPRAGGACRAARCGGRGRRSHRLPGGTAGLHVPLVALVPLDAAALGAAEAAGDQAGEVGGADHAGLGAELGADDVGLGAVAAAGQVALEGVAGGTDEQVVGGRDTAADDEAGRVEGGGQVGDADAEPLADVLEQFDAHGVAVPREFGDHRAADLGDVPFDVLDDPVGDGRVGGGQFACLADQGVAGAVLLPAAAVAARAAVAAGHDLHVPELAGDAVLAAFDLAVLQDRAADAGAQRDHHEVVLAAPGAEAPGGGVGVVVDQDGDGETAGEAVPQGLVAPGQVGGEEHPVAVGVDPAGRADPDGVHVVPVGQVQHQFDDGVLDHFGTLGLVRRLRAQLLQDVAVRVDDTRHDFGPADVDAHRRHPGRRQV